MDLLDDNYFELKKSSKTIEQVISEGYSTDVIKNISEAWRIFKAEPGYFIGFLLVSFLISFVVGLVPLLGSFVIYFAISPCLSLGLFLVCKKIDFNEHYEFENFFDGFKLHLNLNVRMTISCY